MGVRELSGVGTKGVWARGGGGKGEVMSCDNQTPTWRKVTWGARCTHAEPTQGLLVKDAAGRGGGNLGCGVLRGGGVNALHAQQQ